MPNDRLEFNPDWDGGEVRFKPILFNLASKMAGLNSTYTGSESDPAIDLLDEEFFCDLRENLSLSESIRLEAAGSLLFDLVKQGRRIEVQDGEIFIGGNGSESLSVQDQKSWIRKQELIKRDEQLAIPSVRRFIDQMESSRLYDGKFVSIFSLMRDGQDLADSLESHRDAGTLDIEFRNIIQPYVQVITSDQDKCEFTGFPLSNIWRYFRHTWANQSTSVPGRSMRFLVRDRAAPCHPILGIGAIGSPIIALTDRDKEIGWDRGGFLKKCRSMSGSQLLSWVNGLVDYELAGLYLKDLVQKEILDGQSLDDPDDQIIERVRVKGEEARELHRKHGDRSEIDRSVITDADCESRALTDLYTWKRCRRLVTILRMKRFLRRLDDLLEDDALVNLLNTTDGKWVLSTAIRLRKAAVIGIDVADIIVCGGIPPYNAVLAGKLVSALAVSPQIIAAYNERYSEQISEIASGMAGRIIVRTPNLVLFGTTSLYGSSSSQYNRIKIQCSELGGSSQAYIQFKRVGVTQSFGTSQFAERTVAALRKLMRKSQDGVPVNYIFGEGVSPKLRYIRNALSELGLQPTALLKHARNRAIYMIPVAENYAEYLLGFEPEPDYLIPIDDLAAATDDIVKWWMNRWAIRRCAQDMVIDDVRRHDFTYPIEHGARVRTPEPTSYQPSLID